VNSLIFRTERIEDFQVVSSDRWSARELAERDCYRDQSRQRAWEAGRLLVRDLLRDTGIVTSEHCEILSRDNHGKHVRANVFEYGRRVPVALSLSHCADYVTAALTWEPHLTLGVDLVQIQPVTNSFLKTWFTPREQQWIAHQPDRAALVWGAKEAIYKAFSDEESFQPLQAEFYRDESKQIISHYRGEEITQRSQFLLSCPVNSLQLVVVCADRNQAAQPDNSRALQSAVASC